jgi:hydroxymethylpyrimidine pyrophosphatase-like HAD family hydrolase
MKYPAVIVDIDGTLTNLDSRLHFITGPKKDWDSFYGEVKNDIPNTGVIEWVKAIRDSGIKILIVTGRRLSIEKDTVEWLKLHGVDYDGLWMPRCDGDKRDDRLLKEMSLIRIKDRYEILFCIDDRPSVCDMWRQNGLRVFPVFQNRWENGE